MSRRRTTQTAAAIAGAGVAEAATTRFGTATRRVLHDASELRRVGQQFAAKSPEISKGHTFEFLEVLKFNEQAALAGREDLYARATHFDAPHAPQDIQVFQGLDMVREAQAKANGKATNTVFGIREAKYEGMDRLVPTDRVDDVQRLLDKRIASMPEDALARDAYVDAREHLTGRLEHDGVGSPGTTTDEALFAARHPELAAMSHTGQAVLRELGAATAIGAASGAATGAVMQGMLSAWKVHAGRQDARSALADVGAATASAAVRGGAVAGGAKAFTMAVRGTGWAPLARGSGPAAIAAGVLEAGQATHRFLHGRTDAATWRQEMGLAALASSASFYGGVAGQMLIPVPVVGALVGSTVGYLSASILVESGVLGLGAHSIVAQSAARRAEVEAEVERALVSMAWHAGRLDALAAEWDLEVAKPLLASIERLGDAPWEDPGAELIDLARIRDLLGVSFPWRDQEGFDAWMLDERRALAF